MQMLRVYSKQDLANIPAGTWGIREPGWEWEQGRRASALDPPPSPMLDTIVVPGVAFDPTLARIGHGKGYYDRFISLASSHALRQERPRPLLGTLYILSNRNWLIPYPLVALALREQIVEPGAIPEEEHDWKVDLIITPDQIIGDIAGLGERVESKCSSS
jgi:5-formyltetrahydrofolate cyclo-ligase